jgi:hypothetical protein
MRNKLLFLFFLAGIVPAAAQQPTVKIDIRGCDTLVVNQENEVMISVPGASPDRYALAVNNATMIKGKKSGQYFIKPVTINPVMLCISVPGPSHVRNVGVFTLPVKKTPCVAKAKPAPHHTP